jgi:hypothetical protein
MNSYFRFVFVAIAVLVGSARQSSALAADYRVEVGAETLAAKDAATFECSYGQRCIAKLESLDLSASIYVQSRNSESASINLDGNDVSCCLFANAADSISVDLRRPQSRVVFFKGVSARGRGGLFIKNERAGTLYIRFNLVRDRI